MIVNFRHLSPRKSVSGHFWIGSSDCRRAEKNCIVNSNHLNNMACLLLSLNMAPLFAASQLWHPLFSREGKGDLCFQLRSINWLPLLLLFLLLILAFFFFFIWCMIWGNNLEHEPFGEQIYVCFPLKFFLSFSALGRFCQCLLPPSSPSDWPFYFLSVMKKLPGAKACDSK